MPGSQALAKGPLLLPKEKTCDGFAFLFVEPFGSVSFPAPAPLISQELTMSEIACPDKEKLFGYVMGTITPAEADEVAAHLDLCSSCEQTVTALEGLSDSVVSALRQPPPVDAFADDPQCARVREQLRHQMASEGLGEISQATSWRQTQRTAARLGRLCAARRSSARAAWAPSTRRGTRV